MRNKFFIIIFSLISVTASSQHSSRGVSAYIFHPEWYSGANAGLNSYWAEGMGGYIKTQPLSTIALMGRFTAGYNFTPVLGVRGMLGYAGHSWAQSTPAIVFGAENLTVDVTANLSNLKGGYNLHRRFDFSVFAGLGGAYRDKSVFNPDIISLVTRGGLQADYHFNKVIDINLIAELNIVSDNYNGTPVENPPFDLYPALTVGVTYHLRGSSKFFW